MSLSTVIRHYLHRYSHHQHLRWRRSYCICAVLVAVCLVDGECIVSGLLVVAVSFNQAHRLFVNNSLIHVW